MKRAPLNGWGALALIVGTAILGPILVINPALITAHIPGTEAHQERAGRERENTRIERRNAKIRKHNDAIARQQGRAKSLCLAAVRSESRFPSEVSMTDFMMNTRAGLSSADAKTMIVRGRVKLMNALGHMIPHVVECRIRDGVVTTTEVTPG